MRKKEKMIILQNPRDSGFYPLLIIERKQHFIVERFIQNGCKNFSYFNSKNFEVFGGKYITSLGRIIFRNIEKRTKFHF